MLQVCAFSIISVLLYTLVKQQKAEYAILVQLACVCVILLFLVPELKKIIDFSQEFFDASAIDKEYFVTLLKALGITIITQISADICRDSGDSALATEVELAGRVIIIVMALPMLRALVQLVTGLI